MSLQYTSGPEAGSQDNGKLLLGYEDAAFMQSLQNSASVLRSLILHATLANTEFFSQKQNQPQWMSLSNNCRNLQLGSEKCYSKTGKEAKVFIFTKFLNPGRWIICISNTILNLYFHCEK